MAGETFEGELTREDIRRGRRGNSLRCPLANSLRRITGEKVSVEGFQVVGETFKADIPHDVWLKVLEYDLEGKMEPFNFSLPISPI